MPSHFTDNMRTVCKNYICERLSSQILFWEAWVPKLSESMKPVPRTRDGRRPFLTGFVNLKVIHERKTLHSCFLDNFAFTTFWRKNRPKILTKIFTKIFTKNIYKNIHQNIHQITNTSFFKRCMKTILPIVFVTIKMLPNE